MAAVAALFCLHVPAAIYLSVWHQSGALSAVDVVAERIPVIARTKIMSRSQSGGGGGTEAILREERGGPKNLDEGVDVKATVGIQIPEGSTEEGDQKVMVHYLMPCHSAPLSTHLHFRGLETVLWSLDCSPE